MLRNTFTLRGLNSPSLPCLEKKQKLQCYFYTLSWRILYLIPHLLHWLLKQVWKPKLTGFQKDSAAAQACPPFESLVGCRMSRKVLWAGLARVSENWFSKWSEKAGKGRLLGAVTVTRYRLWANMFYLFSLASLGVRGAWGPLLHGEGRTWINILCIFKLPHSVKCYGNGER